MHERQQKPDIGSQATSSIPPSLNPFRVAFQPQQADVPPISSENAKRRVSGAMKEATADVKQDARTQPKALEDKPLIDLSVSKEVKQLTSLI